MRRGLFLAGVVACWVPFPGSRGQARKAQPQRGPVSKGDCGWSRPPAAPKDIASRRRVKYLIVSQPRSGSTWFGTRVGSHPCVAYRHETGHQVWMSREKVSSSSNEGCFDAYFRDALAEAVKSDKLEPATVREKCAALAVGGKIWGSQLLAGTSVPARIIKYISNNDVRVVVLERENVVDKMISSMEVRVGANKFGMHCRIQKNNQTSCGPGGAVQERVDIDVPKLRELVHTADRNNKALYAALNHTSFIWVKYEHLRREPHLFADVIEFLGFPRHDANLLHDRLVKRITKSRRQLIRNYAQVQAELAKLGRLHWLDEEEQAASS